jgi:hypothetical protein
LTAARAKGYVEGTVDRLGGTKDAVVGTISGDRQQETAGVYSFYPMRCFDPVDGETTHQAKCGAIKGRCSRTSTARPELVANVHLANFVSLRTTYRKSGHIVSAN